MSPLHLLKQAMQSDPSGEKLRQIILALKQEGQTKEEIYEAMNLLIDQVRELHGGVDSDQEDTLLEIMDLIVGWCNPRHRLFD
jgi:hypothetical protein